MVALSIIAACRYFVLQSEITQPSVPARGIHMAISNVSPAAANLHSLQPASKPVSPQQSIKPVVPPVTKTADTDGDRDGSGINVKA
jgi:hypothetical protein